MNYVEEKNGEDGTLLLARNQTSGDQENTWYLDTSVSNHMSRNRSIFVELNESVNGVRSSSLHTLASHLLFHHM